MELVSLEGFMSFDYEHFLKNIYLLTGAPPTLYNAHRQWIGSYPNIPCPFCDLVRRNEQCLAHCRACDREALDACEKTQKTLVYRCHLGMYEIAAPLYNQGELSGFLLLGQVRSKQREDMLYSIEHAKKYVESEADLRAALENCKQVPMDKIQAIAQLLTVYAFYISENNLMKNQVSDLAYSIAQYIQENLSHRITNAELSGVFFYNRKTLTKAFHEAYGMSITDYANNLRMTRAKSMMKKNPRLSVGAVAKAVGITDQGYFSKLFLQKYGESAVDTLQRYKNDLMKNQ